MSNKPPNGTPDAAEVAIARQWLRDHSVPAQITAQLVNPANTRRQNTEQIIAWLKARPKASER
jgi:hypothetical protein